MSDSEVIEKKTTVTQQPRVGQTGQTTNVNVRPDGGAEVQVNDGTTNGRDRRGDHHDPTDDLIG